MRCLCYPYPECTEAPGFHPGASETTPYNRWGFMGDPLTSPLVVAYKPPRTIPILTYPLKVSVKSTISINCCQGMESL